MRRIGGGLLRRAKRRVIADLRTDPYLPYILLLATVLAGFWFWHLIPNFATADGHWRLIDPLRAARRVAADPGFESLQQGIMAGRLAGATFYLYGLAVLPVILLALVVGPPGVFQGGFPEWVVTWSLLLARFATVVLAVGCVYLTYRIGTTIRNRPTGRLAAIVLSITWGFLVVAHEVGEDMPMTFCFLLVLYLALRYIETGDETTFLTGCAVGGFAIAFKLTAATSVIVLGVAHLLRARRERTNWLHALMRPRLLGTGAVLGLVGIFVGFPEVLVGGPDVFVDRIFHHLSSQRSGSGGPSLPIWWWLLRGYLTGLGLPLFVAALGGVVMVVFRLRERPTDATGIVVVLTALTVYLVVFSRWRYVRVHHLLPTFPLLALLLAAALTRVYDTNRTIARPLVAVLLITSGAYAGVGSLHYASAPWDETIDWLETNAPENATMEVYRQWDMNAAMPYGMRTSEYKQSVAGMPPDQRPTRTEWILAMPQRCPEYIQLNYWDMVHLGISSPGQTQPPAEAEYKRGFNRPPWMPPVSPTPRRAEYIRDLLNGEYNYTVAAEFGPRPPLFGPQPRSQTSLMDLLYAGVNPWTVQYGDEQELRIEQYTILLERTGRCNPSNN